jgi:hypothetical protein
MEEPGMDRGRHIGAGLLTARPLFLIMALGLFFFSPSPAAQTPPAGPRILQETDPPAPEAGGRWTLTILVDHPRPGEVEVRPPRFPGALFPEQNRRESRLVENRRWTAVEYRFVAAEPGAVTLPPFEIITPGGMSRTAPLGLIIRAAGDGAGEFRPRLEWEPLPARLETGKPREIFLRLAGWDPRRPLPGAAVFSPPVPPGVILEAGEPGPGDREAGRVLRLRIIPLSGPRFTLPGRSVRYEGLLLDIPPLSIPVQEPAAPR